MFKETEEMLVNNFPSKYQIIAWAGVCLYKFSAANLNLLYTLIDNLNVNNMFLLDPLK